MKELKFVCENDETHDVVDKDKSNNNWKVYLNICPKCGGATIIPFPPQQDITNDKKGK